MSLLNEAVKDEVMEKELLERPVEIEEEAGIRLAMPDLSFLAASTGPGPIEDYIDHPLNYDSARSTARILRGLTGFAGSLDYALIDIGLGFIEKIQEKKVNTNGTDYAGQ